ncbi:Lipase member M [Turdus rufiventris]|nr:Lipase member M [Turdus rufiventris]
MPGPTQPAQLLLAGGCPVAILTLLKKLAAQGLDRSTLCWVKNWLDGQAQRVQPAGEQSPVVSLRGLCWASSGQSFHDDMDEDIKIFISKFADDTKLRACVDLLEVLFPMAFQSEIIRYHGFPSEEYEVTTEDGYILAVYRIPAGRNSQNTGKKPAVLLHHGILADSIQWISNLPNNSLGFVLADAGYDVWLGNSRGNTWSVKHKTLKPCQKEFWQFSFDEIGKYDIPAELNFIMNKTGQKHIYYIGHSEGSTADYSILCFGTSGHYHTFYQFSVNIYTASPAIDQVGGRTQNMNTSRTDSYSGHYPAGTSVQNVIHWQQILHANHLQAYDYGSKENMKKYNQTVPPVYKIEEIKTPIAVWSGGQDTVADPKDMARLLPRITNLIYHENFPAWGHLDFLWGLDATEKMYLKIIELLKKYA